MQGCNNCKHYSNNLKKIGMSTREFRNCLVKLLNLINVLIETVEVAVAEETAETTRRGLLPNLAKNYTPPRNLPEKYKLLYPDMFSTIPERDTSVTEPDKSVVKRDRFVPGLDRSAPERDRSVPIREGCILRLERSVSKRAEPIPKRSRSATVLDKLAPQYEPLKQKCAQKNNSLYLEEFWNSINFTACSEKKEKSSISDKEEKELDTSSSKKPPVNPSSTIFCPKKPYSESEYFSKEEPNRNPVPPPEDIYFDALESEAEIVETSSSVSLYFNAEDKMNDAIDLTVEKKIAQHKYN